MAPTKVFGWGREGTELGRGHWCLHILVLSEARQTAGQTALELAFGVPLDHVLIQELFLPLLLSQVEAVL